MSNLRQYTEDNPVPLSLKECCNFICKLAPQFHYIPSVNNSCYIPILLKAIVFLQLYNHGMPCKIADYTQSFFRNTLLHVRIFLAGENSYPKNKVFLS